jgi:hypothetical protein
MVEASYKDLFALRDHYAPGVPVFGHCYDFPIPNGVHPSCAGPWLKPSLDFCGWFDLGYNTNTILHRVLVDFRNRLVELKNSSDNNFVLIETQGLLAPRDWANELHPIPNGFYRIAQRFAEILGHHYDLPVNAEHSKKSRRAKRSDHPRSRR